MRPEDRKLLDEISDRYLPEEGEPFEAALAAHEAFVSDMSRLVSARLLGALANYASSKGIQTSEGRTVVSLPASGGTVAGMYEEDRTTGRVALALSRIPAAPGAAPEPILDLAAVRNGDRLDLVRWDPVGDWRSVVGLSEHLRPHLEPRPDDRRPLLGDRLLDADEGLPGETFRSALSIVVGRVAAAALQGLPQALEDLSTRNPPGVPTAIGNGWTAMAKGWPNDTVRFVNRSTGEDVEARAEWWHEQGGSPSRMLILSGDMLGRETLHDTTTGRIVVSEYLPLRVLFSLADVCDKAVGAAAALRAEEETRAPAP